MPTVNPKVVDECKRLLAWAEKGDITEMAFMVYGADIFSFGYHYSRAAEIPTIAGETGALAASIHNDMLRGRMPQLAQSKPRLQNQDAKSIMGL